MNRISARAGQPISKLKTDSLAHYLTGAAQTLALVFDGVALPAALGMIVPDSVCRGAIQDLSYRTLRQIGRVDALIHAMTTRVPKPALLFCLLRVSLALMVEEDTTRHPYAEFTVVDQAVNAAVAHPDLAHAKNMVNALLRRFLRERSTLLAQVMQSPSALWNYPAWWIKACQVAYPNDWSAILKAGHARPPLTLRVNQRKISLSDYIALLEKNNQRGTPIGPYAVRLEQAVGVQHIPGFNEGFVSVQDAAAQLAAPLLDVQNGMRVLDACAAPGGKTGHLLEMAQIDLLALDCDASRLRKVAENCERLQLSAQLKVGDATQQDWWDGQLFDRVLADVPCTASGIVRRHPDIPWLRRFGDAAQLATLSAQILDNLWKMTKPGGKLLLVTCSIWPQESEAQAAAFAQRQQIKPLITPKQMLPMSTMSVDHDGLFFALFQKS